MRPLTALVCLVSFLGPAFFHAVEAQGSYRYGFDALPLVRRQNDEQPIVVGQLPLVNGSTPVRPEIRQMKRNVPKWNLYLLALSMMQYTDQAYELSWYQITGIHGVPFVPWNGVPQAPGGQGGYCTHMSILFPTWHRPYLALYEQALFHLTRQIASWFSDPDERELYQAAAATFRIPYWDWALTPPDGEPSYLEDFRHPFVLVYGPNGLQNISNPLYSYRFRPLDPTVFDFGNFTGWTETKRAPFANISRNDVVATAVQRIMPSLRERLFNLFSNSPDYGPFSNKAQEQRTTHSGYDSLESLHDEIHIEVGNRGHLYYIQYSAFDPVFFLHHTMVDRVVAMWQVMYPYSWVPSQNTTNPSFTVARGTIQNVTTNLAPFRTSVDGTFWTSETVRYTQAFGYTYPELVGLNPAITPGRDPDDRARMGATINRLYGAASPSSLVRMAKRNSLGRGEGNRPELSRLWGWMRPFFGLSKRHVTPSLSPGSRMEGAPYSALVAEDGRYTEWLANIRVANGALRGSFSLLFFIGPPPSDIDEWRLAPNLVGTMGVFAMTGSASENQVCGTVPLTSSLIESVGRGTLSRLDVGNTRPYLQDTLQFRIAGPDGEVDPITVQGLCIQIANAQVSVAEHDWELPKWGEIEEQFALFC